MLLDSRVAFRGEWTTPIRGHDLVGLLIAVALGSWIVLSASMNDSNPVPQLALLIGAAAAFLVGRISPVRTGSAVVTGVAVTTGLIALPETFHGPPRSTPLDYENAGYAGHDPRRYRRHVTATLFPGRGEGLSEAAADFNRGTRL